MVFFIYLDFLFNVLGFLFFFQCPDAAAAFVFPQVISNQPQSSKNRIFPSGFWYIIIQIALLHIMGKPLLFTLFQASTPFSPGPENGSTKQICKTNAHALHKGFLKSFPLDTTRVYLAFGSEMLWCNFNSQTAGVLTLRIVPGCSKYSCLRPFYISSLDLVKKNITLTQLLISCPRVFQTVSGLFQDLFPIGKEVWQ